MKHFWIKSSLIGLLISLILAIGLGFGFKDKLYLKANLNSLKKEIIINKKDYELIKTRKKIQIKINQKEYQVNINNVNNLKTFYILKTDFKFSGKEKLVDVLIFYKTQPIIKSMIDGFKIN